MRYWGEIEQASAGHLPTAQLWAAIRGAATREGLATPGVSAADVSRLRGRANQIRTSAEQLAKANPADSLSRFAIPAAPFGRSQDERNTLPIFQARFQHFTTLGGIEQEPSFKVVTFRGGLPNTIADLTAQVERDAAQLAENYQQGHVGIGSITLYAV